MTKEYDAAKQLSKLGAVKGGKARAARLTGEERAIIARNAALSRWEAQGKELPVLAKYGAPDRPLKIGEIEIQCYVLADGRRVLTQRSLQTGIGLSRSGVGGGEQRLILMMATLASKGINIKNLITSLENPIKFTLPRGNLTGFGYEAPILVTMCEVLVDAAQKGALNRQQIHLGEQARILLSAFATVGIIALVDEVTGYQDSRARDALAKILEAYVQAEIRRWVKTFPIEFYREIYRLNGWQWDDKSAGPRVIGHWTNNIVYKRLAPGVLEELRKHVPRNESGRLKRKLFQHLTEDYGHPRLREHLAAVTMLMKYSPNWVIFMERLDREFPQQGTTKMLPFPDDYQAPPVK